MVDVVLVRDARISLCASQIRLHGIWHEPMDRLGDRHEDSSAEISLPSLTSQCWAGGYLGQVTYLVTEWTLPMPMLPA